MIRRFYALYLTTEFVGRKFRNQYQQSQRNGRETGEKALEKRQLTKDKELDQACHDPCHSFKTSVSAPLTLV